MLGIPEFFAETPPRRWRRMELTVAHDLIANLEAMLARGGDGAALRLALASRYLDAGDAPSAVKHAQAAVQLDPEYSAGWKALGRALAAAGRNPEALAAYERGAAVADRRGDRQAANEMRVFAKRLGKIGAMPEGGGSG